MNLFSYFSRSTISPDLLLFSYFSRSIVGWICSSQIYFSLGWCFPLRFLRTFTLLKKGNNFWFFSFFYHLLRSNVFAIIFLFMDIFLWDLLFFVLFYCWINVLFSDLLYFVAFICLIGVFFSDLLCCSYFPSSTYVTTYFGYISLLDG